MKAVIHFVALHNMRASAAFDVGGEPFRRFT